MEKGTHFLCIEQSSHSQDIAKTPTVSKDSGKYVRYIKTRRTSVIALGREKVKLFSHNRGEELHCSFTIHTDQCNFNC